MPHPFQRGVIIFWVAFGGVKIVKKNCKTIRKSQKRILTKHFFGNVVNDRSKSGGCYIHLMDL